MGREDPPEKGIATHSRIFTWEISWTEEPGGATVHGVAKSQTQLSDQYFSLLECLDKIRAMFYNEMERFLLSEYLVSGSLLVGGLVYTNILISLRTGLSAGRR